MPWLRVASCSSSRVIPSWSVTPAGRVRVGSAMPLLLRGARRRAVVRRHAETAAADTAAADTAAVEATALNDSAETTARVRQRRPGTDDADSRGSGWSLACAGGKWVHER